MTTVHVTRARVCLCPSGPRPCALSQSLDESKNISGVISGIIAPSLRGGVCNRQVCTWRCHQTIPTVHTGNRLLRCLYKRNKSYDGEKIVIRGQRGFQPNLPSNVSNASWAALNDQC